MNPTNQPQPQQKNPSGGQNQNPQYGQPNQQGRQGDEQPNTFDTPHEGERTKSQQPNAKNASAQGNQQNR